MFKRKIYNDLLKWKKESNGKSALLIEGARHIGKTTPLEIKSKKVSSLSSLNEFKNKYGKNVGDKYIVKPKPLSFENNVINLPSYMLFTLMHYKLNQETEEQ